LVDYSAPYIHSVVGIMRFYYRHSVVLSFFPVLNNTFVRFSNIYGELLVGGSMGLFPVEVRPKKSKKKKEKGRRFC